MALQRINPGLSKNTKVTTKQKFYSDIDLSLTAKPGSQDVNGVFKGDIYKKTDVAAVVQSVKNIILTNTLEKPFEPSFGANIRSILFETTGSFSSEIVVSLIKTQIEKWEPRAKVTAVNFSNEEGFIASGIGNLQQYYDNTLRISVEFDINNKGFYTTSVQLNRFR